MKRILALVALVSPLVFAPLAFGADDPDATFYKKATEGGLFEVDTGNQAAKSSNNQQVKDFGSVLVTDHTAADDKLKAIAASKNITLPTTASVAEMAQKAKLDVLTGDTYDKSFVKTQIKAHRQAIALFKKEIATGQDADAKAFATETLPTLRKHLKMAESIAAAGGYAKS
jgi:putative membrane protein